MSNREKAIAIGACTLWAAFVAGVDYWTGKTIPLTVGYLPVVIVSCWLMRPTFAILVATVCASIWMIDDLVALDFGVFTRAQLWLTTVHFIFFIVINLVLIRLRAAMDVERRLARTDALTGLVNLRGLVEVVEEVRAAAAATGKPTSVALLDCDNFKQVNDQQGHLTGDKLLKVIASAAAAAIPKTGISARLGGDEFAFLFPGYDEHQVRVVAEVMHHALNESMQANQWNVTFSIGVVTFESAPENAKELLRQADAAMYEVKRTTKNAIAFRKVA